MVMRNRNDGAHRERDDLPPRVRARISDPFDSLAEPGRAAPAEPEPPVTRGELLRDLVKLALLFLGITVANMLFLLAALAFIGSY